MEVGTCRFRRSLVRGAATSASVRVLNSISDDEYTTSGQLLASENPISVCFAGFWRREWAARGSLFDPHRFAIMRPTRELDGFSGFDSALASERYAKADLAADVGSADSASWIPEPPDELESTDLLEDRDVLRGAGVVGWLRDGRSGVGRAWARTRLPFRKLEAELAWIARPDHEPWRTIRLEAANGRAQVAGGAVVARHGPVLLAEALSLTRPLRGPISPRIALSGFEAPRGATSLAFQGAGIIWIAGSATGWCLAGRNGTGASLGAGGVAVAGRGYMVSASGGARTSESTLRVVSLAGKVGPPSGWISGEVLASPLRGPALLCEAARRSGPLLAAARWRRRPGEERPVAGELALEAASRRSGPAALARLTWSTWSSHAASDDGRLELETAVRRRGPGSSRVRIGGRPGGERYALADLEIARERGRSFTLIASRRERRGVGASSVGSTWGGRFDWRSRRAGATLFLQATRVSAGDGVTSWATAIAPSGDESLVARGHAGVAVTGRAWLHAGPLQMEALLSDAGSSDADPPMRGTLRLEWAREDH
jgi:hypothetical protein